MSVPFNTFCTLPNDFVIKLLRIGLLNVRLELIGIFLLDRFGAFCSTSSVINICIFSDCNICEQPVHIQSVHIYYSPTHLL